MISKQILLAAEEKMKKTTESFRQHLTTIRAGRANPAILDTIKVEAYGTAMPLKQLAAVNLLDSRTLEIKPWDTSQIAEVEKAILKSNLGLTPLNDGKSLKLTIPPLTEERRQELIRTINKIAEDYRVSVRNERRQILEQIKKAEKDKQISEDDRRKGEQELQKLTENYIKQIDSILQQKEKEIKEV